jgi:hypothetical protein
MEETQPNTGNPATPNTLQETVTVTTVHGHTVVLKGYASGGDMSEMQRVVLAGRQVEVSLDDKGEAQAETKSVTVDGSIMLDRENKALQLLVISVDGVATDVYKLVRDLPKEDYDQVVEKLNEITAPLVPTPSAS